MTHRILLEDGSLPDPGEDLVVVGPEAHHAARVKRLEPGASVALGDGRGGEAQATVVTIERHGRAEWALRVRVDRRWLTERVRPRIDVASGVPKGARLEALIDQLSQVGAASWRPFIAERSVVDPRPGKLDRLRRVAMEAAKQCWRPWLLEIGEGQSVGPALARAREGHMGRLVVADPSGSVYVPNGSASITLLIGPEGGWTLRELEAARGTGASVMCIGPHVMRIEAAAPIAAALILDAERRFSGRTAWNTEEAT